MAVKGKEGESSKTQLMTACRQPQKAVIGQSAKVEAITFQPRYHRVTSSKSGELDSQCCSTRCQAGKNLYSSKLTMWCCGSTVCQAVNQRKGARSCWRGLMTSSFSRAQASLGAMLRTTRASQSLASNTCNGSKLIGAVDMAHCVQDCALAYSGLGYVWLCQVMPSLSFAQLHNA